MIFTLQSNYRLLAVITCLLSLNYLPASAQVWQWGKRGGGMFDGNASSPTEKVVDMATDKNGNVYILAIAIKSAGNPTIDGNTLNAYGDRDIVFAKFNCNGAYQWSKVIGGTSTDYPTAIGVDTLGHVYVSGKLWPNDVHFDTDSVQQPNNEKNLFLVQYDTSGVFKWLRQPNADTATLGNIVTCESYNMKVMPNGEVFWMVKLHEGPVSGGNGWVVSGRKPFILQYNAVGNMVSHIDLQMETDLAAFYEIGIERTRSGKFIIAGGQNYYAGISNFTMGGQQITHSLFIGMFSASGQLIWKKENNIAARNSRISSRPLLDTAGTAIYFSGTISINDVFGTYTHSNFLRPTASFTADPFVCKMDTTGNITWIKATSGLSANYTTSLAFKGTNELWVSGDYTSAWWDSTYRLQTPLNTGTHIFVTRFNTQGNVLAIDSLKGASGTNNYFYTSTSDDKGNVYVGGEFPGTMPVAGQTLVSAGGSSDFFFAKLGVSCNCTTPAAAFSMSVSATTVSLAYTGTTTGIDSVVWDYGNSASEKKTGSAISAPFTYTYTDNGIYNICVTAYGNCGSAQSCQSISISGLGVGNVAGMENVKTYPNPANDYIMIEGAADGTTGYLLNLIGQDVRGGKFTVTGKKQLSLKGLPAGTYLLILSTKNGLTGTVRIVKQ